MAKGSYGRSKAARRADSESYLTVLPTPELPYETESADQAYLRQAGMSNSVVSCQFALVVPSPLVEAASAAGEHVKRLGLDPV
jgi:hypothetical protein